MFKLNNLASPLGSKQYKKRKGKGIGTGLGKTAGKGHKGQRARTGHGVGHWFEGGQSPLQRRLPKIGFRSALKKNLVKVNVTELVSLSGKEASLKDLLPSSQRKNSRAFLAVEGTRQIAKAPKSIVVHKIAPKAKSILEAMGCKIQVVDYKDGTFSTRKPKK